MQNSTLKKEESIWDLELDGRISTKHILESVGVIDCVQQCPNLIQRYGCQDKRTSDSPQLDNNNNSSIIYDVSIDTLPPHTHTHTMNKCILPVIINV
jgi:hypothetical protein